MMDHETSQSIPNVHKGRGGGNYQRIVIEILANFRPEWMNEENTSD